MTTPNITPGAIVVGYSGEEDAEQALAWAAEQASLEKRHLAVVHVVRTLSGFADTSLMAVSVVEDLNAAVEQGGREVLTEGAQEAARMFPDIAVETHLLAGSPEHVLREAAEHAACLVVGSRGRGRLASALLGSVGVSVAGGTACPVVVVRPHHRAAVRNGVLVGTDCSPNTHATLEYAYREASLRQLPLTVLYAVPGPQTGGLLDPDAGPGSVDEPWRRELAEAVAGLGEKFPDVRARMCLGSGTPARWLVSQSAHMDLLVVGHHYRSSVADRLSVGSYAALAVARADCPIAVVFEAPAPAAYEGAADRP